MQPVSLGRRGVLKAANADTTGAQKANDRSPWGWLTSLRSDKVQVFWGSGFRA